MDENKLLSPVPISFPPAPKTAPTVASDTTFPKVVLCPCMVRLTTPPTTLAVPAVAAVANRLAPPVSPAAPPVIKPCNAEPPTAFQSDIFPCFINCETVSMPPPTIPPIPAPMSPVIIVGLFPSGSVNMMGLLLQYV